ncbi:SemiSWEET transporter [Terrimonas sp. NA20]|uniref:SemiSWEET transporter n=1 Tax=Terrimonas ginsenosidimutans TaxID=2908004 RepID=A0ABS9KS28_9BACT|nr:SemiSWEET transporter [Terrimonas ginsenosidimutans]MCG2615116.1 SemiSWEET transporter [Terrimonas ginsenosidimutans]
METEQLIGIVAGVCTGISLVPQLVKIRKEKQAEGTSTVMLITLLLGLGGWIVYGVMRTDYPVIFTNAFSFIINIWIMCLSVKYSRRKDLQKRPDKMPGH